MSTGNRDAQQDAWLARITLEFSEAESPVGAASDLEDLAALLDNRLDATRRAQVISHLAQDPELYAQWQQLLTYHHLLPQSEIAEAPGITVWSQLHARLGRWLTPVSGSVLASALLVGTLVFWPQQQTLTVDDLYASHQSQLISFLDQRPILKIRALPKVMNDHQVQILAGIEQGQRSVGKTGSIAGIAAAQLDAASEQYQQRYGETRTERFQLGRWLLISQALCGQDAGATEVMRSGVPKVEGSDLLQGPVADRCTQVESYLRRLSNTLSEQK